MKRIVLILTKCIAMTLVAILITGLTGCHTETPVFTPNPKDYPCHNQDGSAETDANWCYPLDGTHTCCHAGLRCVTNNGCQVISYDGYLPSMGASPELTQRFPDRQPSH